jgi:hypothetical protein
VSYHIKEVKCHIQVPNDDPATICLALVVH